MKLLFVMASPEYLRYFDSTIRLLADHGHSVHVAVNRLSEKKSVRLQSLAGASRIVLMGAVPRQETFWYPLAKRIRGTIDYVRFLDPRFSNARLLRTRMMRKALPKSLHALQRIRSLSTRNARLALDLLTFLDRAIPVDPAVDQFIGSIAPDAVVVSPLVDAASDQVDIVKVARARGIPVGLCVASWDNLTNKGHVRIPPHKVFVWNETQRREAMDLHGMPASGVVVTGAPAFDRWFARLPRTSRETFCSQVGLSTQAPFIAYVCSSSFISGSRAEVDFVHQWVGAVRNSDDPLVRSLGVLVRPHPYNSDQWREVDLTPFGNAVVWPRFKINPIDEDHRAEYFDTLFHSAGVVGINTSAMIEASIVGRPVYTVLADAFRGTQEGTLHFHYLLPQAGGCVQVASHFAEHLQQLARGVRNGHNDASAKFVQSFVRPRGLDTPSTPILVAELQNLAAGRVSADSRPSGDMLIRGSLWLFAQLIARVDRTRLPRKGRPPLAKPVSATRRGDAANEPGSPLSRPEEGQTGAV